MVIYSPKAAESAFHRSIQPINFNTKLRRKPSSSDAVEKIHFDGTISILKLIGYRALFVTIAREGVQYLSQQIIDAHNVIKEAYSIALPYKNIFFQWITRVYFDLRRKVTDSDVAHTNAERKIDMVAYDSDYYEDSERDFDSHSVFSNADTDISSHPYGKATNPAKVAELENEVLLLKQQLSLILNQMNINVPSITTPTLPATSSLPPPPPVISVPVPPPPPLPANLLKSSEVVISRSKPPLPESSANSQAVPRITEILGDLSKVQLRHVPRSPGGTPCRNRVSSSSGTMADAVKNAINKRRKDFDVSLDENGLNDSWEDEKET